MAFKPSEVFGKQTYFLNGMDRFLGKRINEKNISKKGCIDVGKGKRGRGKFLGVKRQAVGLVQSRLRCLRVNLNRGSRAAVIFQPQPQLQPQPQIARRLVIGGEAKLPLTI
jgi:hypothetical protein